MRTRFLAWALLFLNPIFTHAQSFDKPTAEWVVRLILPTAGERKPDGGVFVEVVNGPGNVRGQKLWLHFGQTPADEDWFAAQGIDVTFGQAAAKNRAEGSILPEGLNGWKRVSPLESLAASRPAGSEMLVKLTAPKLEGGTLRIASEPVQVAAPEMTFVKFLKKVDTNSYQVAHYNAKSAGFDGPVETMSINQFVGKPDPYLAPGNISGIENEALNDKGWVVYGKRSGGHFTVDALEPRALGQVSDFNNNVQRGLNSALKWRDESEWANLPLRKGSADQTLLSPAGHLEQPQLGKKYLVLHVFGANDQTPKTGGLVTGHFSYGVATVEPHPFTGEPYAHIVYDQVYAHNRKGIVAGKIDWAEYMGDLNRGWMYARPVSDVLVDVPELFEPMHLAGKTFVGDVYLDRALQSTMANYRAGKGGGVSVVTLTESCIQDSNQSVLNAIEAFQRDLQADPAVMAFVRAHPESADVKRFQTLAKIASDYRSRLGKRGLLARLGGVPGFINRISTRWRTAIPRRGHDEIAQIFLEAGKNEVALQSIQIGGDMSAYGPLEPTSYLRNSSFLGRASSTCGELFRWARGH